MVTTKTTTYILTKELLLRKNLNHINNVLDHKEHTEFTDFIVEITIHLTKIVGVIWMNFIQYFYFQQN